MTSPRHSAWIDDGHTMTAVMDHDQVTLRASCPGDSCKALAQCPACEGVGTVDSKHCSDCEGRGTLPGGEGGICWLLEWFGEDPAAELFDDGRMDFPASPARIVWRSEGEEGPRWKFAEVDEMARAVEGLSSDLLAVLRDPGVIVRQDAAVFEQIAKWQAAQSDTPSSIPTEADDDDA